jgi:hypothetical protein
MLRKFLKGVLTAAVDATSEAPQAVPYGPVSVDVAASPEASLMLERAANELKALRAELETQRRISQEYFALIESIEKERNVWSEMWKDQAYAHVEAQAMLERALKAARTVAAQAIQLANKYREDKGEPPLTQAILEEASAPPVGVSATYKARVDASVASVGAQVDAVAARDEIASRDPLRTK